MHNKVTDDTIKKMKSYKPPTKNYKWKLDNHIKSICHNIPADALHLILNLLSIDPKRRLSCSEALNH